MNKKKMIQQIRKLLSLIKILDFDPLNSNNFQLIDPANKNLDTRNSTILHNKF